MLPARGSRMESRKRWMLSGLGDEGRRSSSMRAPRKRCSTERSKSLLPAGVREVRGPVQARRHRQHRACRTGQPIACGITNYDDRELAAISGVRSDRIASVLGHQYGAEVVHRNNLVVL